MEARDLPAYAERRRRTRGGRPACRPLARLASPLGRLLRDYRFYVERDPINRAVSRIYETRANGAHEESILIRKTDPDNFTGTTEFDGFSRDAGSPQGPKQRRGQVAPSLHRTLRGRA
jgi:hypothetical protein